MQSRILARDIYASGRARIGGAVSSRLIVKHLNCGVAALEGGLPGQQSIEALFENLLIGNLPGGYVIQPIAQIAELFLIGMFDRRLALDEFEADLAATLEIPQRRARPGDQRKNAQSGDDHSPPAHDHHAWAACCAASVETSKERSGTHRVGS